MRDTTNHFSCLGLPCLLVTRRSESEHRDPMVEKEFEKKVLQATMQMVDVVNEQHKELMRAKKVRTTSGDSDREDADGDGDKDKTSGAVLLLRALFMHI